MRALSDEERRRLLRFFRQLAEDGVEYVVLRKYEQLPQRAATDVDLFVTPEQFERAVELAEAVGFDDGADGGSASLLGAALRNPVAAARTAVSSPAAILRAVVGGHGHSDGAEMCHRRYDGLTLDMVSRLRFPERGGEPVPRAVEVRLLERRRRYGQWYVPSPPDELAHIIAHCLADYDRTFPEYYATRYERLRETVLSDSQYRSQFVELLAYLFGGNATAVLDTVETGGYEGITEPLTLASDRGVSDRRSRAL